MSEVIKRRHRCPECKKEFNIEILIESSVDLSVRLVSTQIRHYTKLLDTRDDWPHAMNVPG